jgi:hypothetical protein
MRPKKRPGKLPDPIGDYAFDSASTSVVTGKHKDQLSSLKVASRHLARLVVAFHLEANLLAFDDFTHTSALYSGNVNENVRAAVVRLNEAEAFRGIKPFYSASGHNEPFHSILRNQAQKTALG